MMTPPPTELTEPKHTDAATPPPIVSVIIPAYNTAQYIGETLDSVFAQTLTNYEVILVNDGSPDTEEMERVLAPYRDRLVYLKQENAGPSSARNRAILAARGEYVALLDSDDIWLPNYLEAQIDALRRDPALDLIYADALLFGDSVFAGRTFMQTSPTRGEVTVESLLRYEASIITSCTVARRQSLIDAGLFDANFSRCEDFDLWVRLANRGGRIGYQRTVLGRHRSRKSSLSADWTLMFESQIRILDKLSRTLPLSPDIRALMAAQIKGCQAWINLERGKRHLLAGKYEQAAEALARASDHYRTLKLRAAVLAVRFAPRLLHRLMTLRHRRLSNRPKATAA